MCKCSGHGLRRARWQGCRPLVTRVCDTPLYKLPRLTKGWTEREGIQKWKQRTKHWHSLLTLYPALSVRVIFFPTSLVSQKSPSLPPEMFRNPRKVAFITYTDRSKWSKGGLEWVICYGIQVCFQIKAIILPVNCSCLKPSALYHL